MAPMNKNNEISVFSKPDDLFKFVADDFMQRAITAVNEKGIFSVVLSGGNTPKALFDLLANDVNYIKNIPWGLIKFFFSDERYVPAADPQSNYHMTAEHLFSKVPVNSQHIYRIPTEFTHPADSAKAYEKTLRDVFHIDDGEQYPAFDLVYLGLGDNAHTASLMPFTKEVKELIASDDKRTLVLSSFVAELDMYRITLTPCAINNAMQIIFLVTGEGKATAVQEVIEGPRDPLHYPAQLIHGTHHQAIWYLDQPAARHLNI
jgi:6-phosphogluconolactonase